MSTFGTQETPRKEVTFQERLKVCVTGRSKNRCKNFTYVFNIHFLCTWVVQGLSVPRDAMVETHRTQSFYSVFNPLDKYSYTSEESLTKDF